MQSDFLVHTDVTDRAITLVLSGELDLLSGPALERALEQLPECQAEALIVDLRGLEFMDSTGLHLLIQAHQQAHEIGRRLVLVRGRDQVQRLLDMSGVSESMTIVDCPAQLLEVDGAAGAS